MTPKPGDGALGRSMADEDGIAGLAGQGVSERHVCYFERLFGASTLGGDAQHPSAGDVQPAIHDGRA
jgi:hypothetical protein